MKMCNYDAVDSVETLKNRLSETTSPIMAAVMVKINGNYIKTISGKSSWKSKAQAKNALHNTIKTHKVGNVMCSVSSYGEFFDELIDSGYIEFVDTSTNESL